MIKIYSIELKEIYEEGYYYIGKRRKMTTLSRDLKIYEIYKEYIGKDFPTYIDLKEEDAPVSDGIVKAFNSVKFIIDKHEEVIKDELKKDLIKLCSYVNDARIRDLWWLIQEMIRNISQGIIYLKERGK